MQNTFLSQQNGKRIDKKRDTNLELFRIITMLLIIAHHYVVNSGLMQLIQVNPTAGNSLFLLLFGAWGKTGINCFVLITGYFMCQSTMTAKKFFKLLLEVLFYRVIINCAFWFTGYQPLSMQTLLRLLPITSIGDGFTSTYLVFMLCIPFINILIKNLSQKQHTYLLLLMSFVYIFFETLKPVFDVTKNYISWYFVLYLFASYVRFYPNKLFNSARVWGCMSAIVIGIGVVSVIVGAWLSAKLGKDLGMYFLTDSNALLPFAIGFCTFMFFKNIHVPYNKYANALAATCFGVLQIHANSDTMRYWLWTDILDNVGVFSKSWMPVHAVGSVIGIFLICAGIDYLRIVRIEKPLFRVWNRFEPKAMEIYAETEAIVLRRLGVSE